MKPSISREAIIDRRQPMLRWSAVFAGAAISVALWVLLQILGMGIGLATIDIDNAGSLRSVGIGTTVWTLAAPVIAMFIGGLIAGRLCTTYSRSVAAYHGFVVWALTAVFGIITTVRIVSMISRLGAMTAESAVDQQGFQQGLTHQQLAQVADTTGKVLLGAGLSLLISLASAILGGAAGLRRARRAPEVVTPPVPPAVPPGTTVVTGA
jgi:hypothetical protein